jgi:hypothetical protein
VSRSVRRAGHVALIGEKRNSYRILVGKLEEKRPLLRPKRSWDDNIKIDLIEVGLEVMDWIHMAEDREK